MHVVTSLMASRINTCGSEGRTPVRMQVTSGTAPRRIKLLKEAKRLKQVHPDWGAYVSSNRLSSSEYRSTLLDSTLTVCPGGHNPETFRMFEALEAG